MLQMGVIRECKGNYASNCCHIQKRLLRADLYQLSPDKRDYEEGLSPMCDIETVVECYMGPLFSLYWIFTVDTAKVYVAPHDQHETIFLDPVKDYTASKGFHLVCVILRRPLLESCIRSLKTQRCHMSCNISTISRHFLKKL